MSCLEGINENQQCCYGQGPESILYDHRLRNPSKMQNRLWKMHVKLHRDTKAIMAPLNFINVGPHGKPEHQASHKRLSIIEKTVRIHSRRCAHTTATESYGRIWCFCIHGLEKHKIARQEVCPGKREKRRKLCLCPYNKRPFLLRA